MTVAPVIQDRPVDHLRVGGQTDPTKLGGAIAHGVRRREAVVLDAIGAAAVNQAVKGLAVAREMLAEDGIDVAMVPEFVVIVIDGADRTVIRLRVVPHTVPLALLRALLGDVLAEALPGPVPPELAATLAAAVIAGVAGTLP